MGRLVNASIEYRQNNGKWKALKVPNNYGSPALLNFWKYYKELAILANIYNGQKLGHYDTGYLFNCVSDRRGLPEDITKEARSACYNKNCPGSWVTLQEILDFDWDQPAKHRVWVNFCDYEEWFRNRKSRSKPSGW